VKQTDRQTDRDRLPWVTFNGTEPSRKLRQKEQKKKTDECENPEVQYRQSVY